MTKTQLDWFQIDDIPSLEGRYFIFEGVEIKIYKAEYVEKTNKIMVTLDNGAKAFYEGITLFNLHFIEKVKEVFKVEAPKKIVPVACKTDTRIIALHKLKADEIEKKKTLEAIAILEAKAKEEAEIQAAKEKKLATELRLAVEGKKPPKKKRKTRSDKKTIPVPEEEIKVVIQSKINYMKKTNQKLEVANGVNQAVNLANASLPSKVATKAISKTKEINIVSTSLVDSILSTTTKEEVELISLKIRTAHEAIDLILSLKELEK